MTIDNAATETSATSTAAPSQRRGHSKYPPSTPEMAEALVTWHDQAVAHLQDPANAPAPDHSLLMVGLPHASITGAELHVWDQGPVFAITIKDRKPRFVVPTGLFIIRALSLCGGPPFIDTNRNPEFEQHYVELLASGFTLQRLMAGAETGEMVRLMQDHHILCPWALRIEPTHPRASRGRPAAVSVALSNHDRNAKAWGLDTMLSRDDYQRLLRGGFRLFDAEWGKYLLRPVRGVGGQ